MNYTKENTFPMYVNSNVKVKYRVDGKEGFQYDNYDQYLGDGSGEHIPQIMMYCGDIVPISDCTLLLKPISKMSDEDCVYLYKHFIGHKTKPQEEMIEIVKSYFTDGSYRTFDLQIEVIFWLIQHGYAISDQLFELGIAEEI